MARRRRLMAEMNIVPYIDVMLVLLVIFMVTTPLLTQGVKVDLPQAQANKIDASQQTPIILTVDDNGKFYLNTAPKTDVPLMDDKITTLVSQQLTRAKQQHTERDVLVRGDAHVDYGKVVRAMVLLQHAGADTVGLITTDTKKG